MSKLRRFFYHISAKTAVAVFLMVSIFSTLPVQASGASISLSPGQGDYFVDGTFEVSILVNTGGVAINAVEINLKFPPDKLQVVNPAVSKSFIEIWANGPSYSNSEGKISFQGGLPSPGINTSAGVVSTIQFRVKSTGKATLQFSEDSKVLANDGSGTNILTSKSPAVFNLQLPAPAGPTVTTPSHPDQNKWYQTRDISLEWETTDGSKEFSYVLDTNPGATPETKSNIQENHLNTTVKEDGIWYFHIRAKNASGWGGTTHYAMKIDATTPAGFTPQLSRRNIPVGSQELARFTTTDALSGIDHYEVRIINNSNQNGNTTFFVEASSPYQLPNLGEGSYKLIVRASDLAGNNTDGTADFSIVRGGAAFAIGAPLFNNPLLNNLLVGLLALLLIIIIVIWLWRRSRARGIRHLQSDMTALKDTVRERQIELQRLLSLQKQSEKEISTITAGGTEITQPASLPLDQELTTSDPNQPARESLPQQPNQ